MKHITHYHAGSAVDEDTCALIVAIERVTCSTPSFGGLRRSGARVCKRCGQATLARPARFETSSWSPLARPRLLPTRRALRTKPLPSPPRAGGRRSWSAASRIHPDEPRSIP